MNCCNDTTMLINWHMKKPDLASNGTNAKFEICPPKELKDNPEITKLNNNIQTKMKGFCKDAHNAVLEK